MLKLKVGTILGRGAREEAELKFDHRAEWSRGRKQVKICGKRFSGRK